MCKILGLTSAFDIEEVDIMSRGMNHSPKEHLICDLTMEPDVFIRREQPCQLGTNDADDIAEHGEEEKAAIEGEDQACTTGTPDGPGKTIQSFQFLVCFLRECLSFIIRGIVYRALT